MAASVQPKQSTQALENSHPQVILKMLRVKVPERS